MNSEVGRMQYLVTCLLDLTAELFEESKCNRIQFLYISTMNVPIYKYRRKYSEITFKEIGYILLALAVTSLLDLFRDKLK